MSSDLPIIRLEQLYPLSDEVLSKMMEPYPAGIPVVWVQEEPENMGAWRSLRTRFGDKFLKRHPFTCISRPPSASPATGSSSSHKQEQEQILSKVFSLNFKEQPRQKEEGNTQHVNRLESAAGRRVHHGS